jgi:hypothetical protein
MKALTSKIVVLALACGVALLPLAARAASLDQEFDCEKWNGGKELRCLFNDGRGGPTAIVKVGNSGKEKVSFDADEYHSLCGFSSRQIGSSPYIAAPGAEVTVPVLAPGSGINCRELFIVNCRVNGVAKNCAEEISAKGYTWKGNKQ